MAWEAEIKFRGGLHDAHQNQPYRVSADTAFVALQKTHVRRDSVQEYRSEREITRNTVYSDSDPYVSGSTSTEGECTTTDFWKADLLQIP